MSAGKSILIVEDEADLAELVRYNLEREGYQCRCAMDGEAALAEARRNPPDLMVLDRMLPKLTGDEVISQLRRDPRNANTLVLMLTAKAEESDELVGFALGADDYVTKPFSIKVLRARIEALFRRGQSEDVGEVLSAGPITLDRTRHELTVAGDAVTITATEFGILWELLAARGRVLSRDQLISSAIGECAVVTDRTIDVHIAALRRKLGSAADLIKTVRGVGYTLRVPTGADS